MVKSKDVSVSLTTKGDISPQPHIDEDRPSTSVDECKDEPKKNGSRTHKKHSVDDKDDTYVPPEVPDPFRFRIHLTPTDKIKVALMTIFVVPIRVFLVTFFLFLTWLGCFIGLLGYSEEELESKPIQGWRRGWRESVRSMVFWAFRTFLIKVEFRGERAPPSEAPILVAGPHSSFYDFATVIAKSPVPSAVIRDETGTVVISTILRFIQPVFVKRSSKESRLTTLTEIKNRATSKEAWSQIVIFPEGTCSNGSVLIKFKQGAFSAGVPIQPVLLRYPNRLNTLTWTWDGPSALKTMWLTTCQWTTKMVIEYLPVYCPSEAERQNPTLYAENVRQLMAAALGIGTTEFSYDDLRYLNTGDSRQSQHTLAIVKLLKFRTKNGLKPEQLPDEIAKINDLIEKKAKDESGVVQATQAEILAALGLESSEAAREMFGILNMVKDTSLDGSEDQTPEELVDLRVFLASLHLVNMDGQSAFKALCTDGEEIPSQSAFCRLCWIAMQIPVTDSRALYHYLKPILSAQTFKEYLISHHDRCKGVVYFDGGKRLAVEAEPGSDSTTDQSVKRQKAE
ncbi:lysophosphatidylcholine acyltransferase 1 [Galendromus occidentalis]|uniref:Lysophosphatidylcholine acyltransferase 1 n=1 Tax=Galendromus occidentalis TaxID=34638 RepID=A0AAJ7PAE8_9ACAR|nr:lysophosphatidylcholine acyltransferase 1 [Galendromus occidentalis]